MAQNHPLIKIYGQLAGTSQTEVDRLEAKAKADDAPATVIRLSSSGAWKRVQDIRNVAILRAFRVIAEQMGLAQTHLDRLDARILELEPTPHNDNLIGRVVITFEIAGPVPADADALLRSVASTLPDELPGDFLDPNVGEDWWIKGYSWNVIEVEPV